jgi:hypothetical protein
MFNFRLKTGISLDLEKSIKDYIVKNYGKVYLIKKRSGFVYKNRRFCKRYFTK